MKLLYPFHGPVKRSATLPTLFRLTGNGITMLSLIRNYKLENPLQLPQFTMATIRGITKKNLSFTQSPERNANTKIQLDATIPLHPVLPVDIAGVLGNVILLEACRKAGVKRYVFASTLYVYGKSGGFYRCSKQACELYIENYHDMFGLEYTILRYGSLYGPRADRRNAINRFVAEALEKGTITYYGAPTALREYIHVEDAALSTVEILGPEYANQNIVLTGNQPMQVGDLFRMIEEMLGKPIEIKYQHDPNSGHYQITPYAFMPKVGRKMTPHLSTELGQGVLKVMEEIHQELHPDLKELGGYLMVDKAD